MPRANTDAFEFLATRRSRPAKTLSGPAPDRAQLIEILDAASRVPDHGALVPWRFIVLDRAALDALLPVITERAEASGVAQDQLDKTMFVYERSPLCVAVVHVPKPTEKIPASEQVLTGGAVCLSLVNAALAKGWGANWLSGWVSYDPELMAYIGLKDGEAVAGLVHIGTETVAPPERPRPDVETLITWGLS